MTRLKVAFLIPALAGGGAERATATIADGLDRRIFEPVVLLERGGPQVFPLGPEVPVHVLGVTRSRQTLRPLVRFLRRERPDVLYAALPHLNLLAAVACRLADPRPRLILSVHSNQGAELASVRNGRLMRTLMPWAYRSADAVVAVSRGIADELRPLVRAQGNLRTIDNPLDVARIAALAQEPVAHPWFDGRHDVVAAMGRLSPEKDFLSLIRSFAMVHRQHPTARLVILGTGDQEAELVGEARALGIESVVHLLGFQHNPFAYLARSTCFVLSSVWEGFGMVIVEAMASGAAVLSTDCPYGPAEILEDGAYGLLTEPRSIDGLRDGMLRLIEDPQLRADLAQRGRARAMRFDIGAVVPQYADLMLEVDSRAHATRGARS